MPSKIFSAAIVGLNAQIIEVETDVSYGLRSFNIVGLPDKAVEESKERIGAALKSSGLQSPHSQAQRVLVNLAPADLKKEGSLYDLPIALGYLLASNQIRFSSLKRLFLGELALDGKLRPIKGVLAFALEAKKQGFPEIIVPQENGPEAALAENLRVIPVQNLHQVINHLENRNPIPSLSISKENLLKQVQYPMELAWIKGQEYAKRALEITAAGAHNLMMIGPPGAGKTLLAKAINSILPPLSLNEALEITRIYSVAGLLPRDEPLVNIRPFRAPHHTSSEVALLGGGNPPRPGEITLSHQGVLFLDEFPEFHRDVLESLRQPLENGRITILRAKHHLTLPAKFTLIGASNPCPCGYYRNPERRCICTSSQIQKYKRKLSGPLIDRFDLFIEVPSLKYEKLIKEDEQSVSEKIRQRVITARQIQYQRFGQEKTNSEMTLPQIKQYCPVPISSQSLLRKYVNAGKLSARGFHRILKLSRTIADLENSQQIMPAHISEALMYRVKDSH